VVRLGTYAYVVGGTRLMNTPCVVQVVQHDLPSGLFKSFASAPQVAWDVETSGLDWRQDRLGTCQLFAPGVGAAIVGLLDDVPTRLAALLESPSVEKVFHHAPFDLRFMVHNWNVRPSSIRCTKVASKLLTPTAPTDAHSLQSLVARHLSVELEKGGVRTSNWSAQHLTGAQIEYAAGDVIHLLKLHDVLAMELRAIDLEVLYEECCTFLPARVDLELGGFPDVFAY
jgi:ribonuclease D